jgi:hypothetical protein
MRTWESNRNSSNLSNKLSYLSFDQGMKRLHYSQGNYISSMYGTLPNALPTLESWVLKVKI